MRKVIKLVISEAAILFVTGLMDWLVGENFAGWIWGGGFSVCVLVLVLMYWQEGRRAVHRFIHEQGEQAIFEPSDGMTVARLIMQAPTLTKVEQLYADFDSQSYKGTKEGQVHVAAARRIRHARDEGMKASCGISAGQPRKRRHRSGVTITGMR